jgi:hypothetical protein
LQEAHPGLDPARLSQLVSCSHALLSPESESLALPDFPADGLESAARLMVSHPSWHFIVSPIVMLSLSLSSLSLSLSLLSRSLSPSLFSQILPLFCHVLKSFPSNLLSKYSCFKFMAITLQYGKQATSRPANFLMSLLVHSSLFGKYCS